MQQRSKPPTLLPSSSQRKPSSKVGGECHV
nr:MAG TPA: hypothetical protein [Caudoviricetes sp.]